jgi:NAD-dependent dihydropyrimidine dehydrogenase PreA subunit
MLSSRDTLPVSEHFPTLLSSCQHHIGSQRFFRIVNINGEGRQYDLSMLKVHRDICGYCGCCVSVCPEGALELIDAYLSVEKNCTSCGICAKVCPLGALEVIHEK